jgi:hypothetical protein
MADMSTETKPKDGDLRVWWIPQIPGKPFFVKVHSFVDGLWLQSVLADYDQFQLDNNIKPDYCNVGGLQRYSEELAKEDEAGNGWCDVEEEECHDIIRASLDIGSGVGPDGDGWDFDLGQPKQETS